MNADRMIADRSEEPPRQSITTLLAPPPPGIERWLSRGASLCEDRDGQLCAVVPEDAWIRWVNARDVLAGLVLTQVWTAGGQVGDLAALSLWAVRAWADGRLATAVAEHDLVLHELPRPHRGRARLSLLGRLRRALQRRPPLPDTAPA
jgi:hypothetical protein